MLIERQLPMDIETLTLEVMEWVSVYHRSNEDRIQAALEAGKLFVAAKTASRTRRLAALAEERGS